MFVITHGFEIIFASQGAEVRSRETEEENFRLWSSAFGLMPQCVNHVTYSENYVTLFSYGMFIFDK
jgi:hypothetical protein